MPNTQFITLLIITVFSLLAGIVSAVVLFGQLNAKNVNAQSLNANWKTRSAPQ